MRIYLFFKKLNEAQLDTQVKKNQRVFCCLFFLIVLCECVVLSGFFILGVTSERITLAQYCESHQLESLWYACNDTYCFFIHTPMEHELLCWFVGSCIKNIVVLYS